MSKQSDTGSPLLPWLLWCAFACVIAMMVIASCLGDEAAMREECRPEYENSQKGEVAWVCS